MDAARRMPTTLIWGLVLLALVVLAVQLFDPVEESSSANSVMVLLMVGMLQVASGALGAWLAGIRPLSTARLVSFAGWMVLWMAVMVGVLVLAMQTWGDPRWLYGMDYALRPVPAVYIALAGGYLLGQLLLAAAVLRVRPMALALFGIGTLLAHSVAAVPVACLAAVL
jgi:hypothetical protein